jgi:hypothetical protein
VTLPPLPPTLTRKLVCYSKESHPNFRCEVCMLCLRSAHSTVATWRGSVDLSAYSLTRSKCSDTALRDVITISVFHRHFRGTSRSRQTACMYPKFL